MSVSPESISPVVLPKKRGRKSKKELEELKKLSQESDNNKTNITFTIQENDIDVEKNDSVLINEVLNSNDEEEEENINESNKPTLKKRGRKPKGGKIIQQVMPSNNSSLTKPNVILHLKCSTKDLLGGNLLCNDVQGFSFMNQNNNNVFENINENMFMDSKFLNEKINMATEIEYDDEDDDNSCQKNKDNDIREVWKKLKILEHYLHVNNVSGKKSACFHDTCDFDNPPVYIPKYFINGTYHVYGCFCSPECAVAYLMNEQIDSSTKFERYYLLNSIYGKVYGYNKCIKPASDPYHLLEKYLGNLTIQEYRSLLRNERLFLIVDKPLTRIMPELHEDNDDFIINNKIIPSNNYQIKKRVQKKQTKNNIINERFGLVQG